MDSGTDMAGTELAWVETSSVQECVAACQRNSRCEFFVRLTSGDCILKTDPITGPAGRNGPISDGDKTCWVRPNDGDYWCISSWDVEGDHADETGCTVYTRSESQCRAACDQSDTCTFYIYFTDGTCALKTNAFKPNACGDTRRGTYVRRTCFLVYVY